MLTTTEVISSLDELLRESIVVTPLGSTSRELYAASDSPSNFYLLGAMGMSVPVALGLALGQPETVIALEGDGGCLMNLGALATAARYGPRNLKVVIVDNEAYGSTGGQPSHSRLASLAGVARECGFERAVEVRARRELRDLSDWLREPGLRIAVVKTALVVNPSPRVPIEPPVIFSRVRDELARRNPAPNALEAPVCLR